MRLPLTGSQNLKGSVMAEWNIPPCRLPEEPYSVETFACYVAKCEEYLYGAADCITSGGTTKEIQECINLKHKTYLKTLPNCDPV